MSSNLESYTVATGLKNVRFHSNSKEWQCQKKISNYHTIVLISFTSKVILKILQANPQQYMNGELESVQDVRFFFFFFNLNLFILIGG